MIIRNTTWSSHTPLSKTFAANNGKFKHLEVWAVSGSDFRLLGIKLFTSRAIKNVVSPINHKFQNFCSSSRSRAKHELFELWDEDNF